jgi:hypothetical protein
MTLTMSPLIGNRPSGNGRFANSVRVVPIDLKHMPAGRAEPLDLAVVHGQLVAPSIEIELFSQNAISRPSFRCPASEIASWRTPSSKHPSPMKTYV